MRLSEVLKDSNYKLTQFDAEKIESLEASIEVREELGKDTPFVNCLVRKKEIRLTPEEVVRQFQRHRPVYHTLLLSKHSE